MPAPGKIKATQVKAIVLHSPSLALTEEVNIQAVIVRRDRFYHAVSTMRWESRQDNRPVREGLTQKQAVELTNLFIWLLC